MIELFVCTKKNDKKFIAGARPFINNVGNVSNFNEEPQLPRLTAHSIMLHNFSFIL